MAQINRTNRAEQTDYLAFNEARAIAPFLFGPEVTAFLTRVNEIAADLAATAASLDDAQDKERRELVDSRRRSRDALHQAYEEVDGVFSPYLSFTHLRRAR